MVESRKYSSLTIYFHLINLNLIASDLFQSLSTNNSLSLVSKNKLEIDQTVEDTCLDAKSIKKHPGVFHTGQVILPVKLHNVLAKVIDSKSPVSLHH
jgi:hypothetical protein